MFCLLAESLQVHGVVPFGFFTDHAVLLCATLTPADAIVIKLFLSLFSIVGCEKKLLLVVELPLEVVDLQQQKLAFILHFRCLLLEALFVLLQLVIVLFELSDVNFLLLEHLKLLRLAQSCCSIAALKKAVRCSELFRVKRLGCALKLGLSHFNRVEMLKELLQARAEMAMGTGQLGAVECDQAELGALTEFAV